MKMFTTAPLPFQGQKRRHVKAFTQVVRESEADIIVDLFGGSGLLSHVAKRIRPQSRVIYNDFDDYHVRLENVDKTNRLIAEIRKRLVNHPKDKKITGTAREEILNLIKSGYVDWVTISSSLLFSMNYYTNLEDFIKQSFYNCVRKSDYEIDGYLDGLEVVKMDYRMLFAKYKNHPKALFILDPPYLSTDVSTYTSMSYWHLSDYLDILTLLTDIKNYVYFTSDKSNVLELFDWCKRKLSLENPFDNATIRAVQTNMNYSSRYTDIMIYKLNGNQQETFSLAA